MVSPFSRIAVALVSGLTIAWGPAPAYAAARELATAQGTIRMSQGRPELRRSSCNELIVEARDALDNHLIAETQPEVDEAGMCRYVISVPAQTAIWLVARPVLVASARSSRANATAAISGALKPSSGSVALRFTIIAPTTFFFVLVKRSQLLLTTEQTLLHA